MMFEINENNFRKDHTCVNLKPNCQIFNVQIPVFLVVLKNLIMDDNKVIEEIDNRSLEEPNPTVAPDGCVNTDASEEPATLNNFNRSDADLHVIHNKRVELDGIQRDLDDLMCRLNTFIADSQEDCATDDISLDGLDSLSLEEEEIVNVTEKQDGPPEKELRLNTFSTGESLANKIYITDGSKPPEINWDAVGPILQKHVNDLQKLHNLNQMTNAVVKRIRNVTQINDALLHNTSPEKDDS